MTSVSFVLVLARFTMSCAARFGALPPEAGCARGNKGGALGEEVLPSWDVPPRLYLSACGTSDGCEYSRELRYLGCFGD